MRTRFVEACLPPDKNGNFGSMNIKFEMVQGFNFCITTYTPPCRIYIHTRVSNENGERGGGQEEIMS